MAISDKETKREEGGQESTGNLLPAKRERVGAVVTEGAAPPAEAHSTETRAVVDPTVLQVRSGLAEALSDLQTLAEQCGDYGSSKLVRDTLAALHGPFRFVILGEVKSGKSSFVNALLGAEVCRVAPEPCTDSIQETVYSADEGVEVIGPNRKRVKKRIPLLQTIAIVNTPGTNSVVRDHEAITREYIPQSDLVVFVMPARNPHTQSAWELLNYAHEEWERKVIFVLQQMDLEMDHLATQIRSVHDYAVKGGIKNPVIFATSAKWEEQGLADQSGMAEVRRFIRHRITGGRHVFRKLQGHASIARKVLGGLAAKLETARKKLEQDRAFRERVQARLGRGRERSFKEVDELLGRLGDAYDAITADFKEEFRRGMEIWPVLRRSLPGGISNQEWLTELGRRFEKALDQRVNRVSAEEAGRFMESMKRLILELLEETRRGASPTETAGSIGNLELQRQDILRGIQAQLEELARDQELLRRGLSESSRQVGQAIVGGSVLTGVGAAIAAVTKLAIFDITGGVLAGLGLLVAGFALMWRRGRIVSQFARALDKAKSQFMTEVRDKLTADLRGIYSVIGEKFCGLDELVEAQEEGLGEKLARAERLDSRLTIVENKVAAGLEPP